MGSLRRHDGYLLIDHTASPGTPEVPEGTKFEAAAITCCHCGRVFIATPSNPTPKGYCRKCDHYTCNHKVCATECNPIKRDVNLALSHPGSGEPFLLRGPQGEILYDPRYIDKEKIF